MNRFNEFNIEPSARGFEGDKIGIERVLNQEITILDYKVEDSKIQKYKEMGAGKCLYLQIIYKSEKRIIFTSGTALMEVIQKIPPERFPFITTIIKENRRYLFS
jgi:hypothetical protein